MCVHSPKTVVAGSNQLVTHIPGIAEHWLTERTIIAWHLALGTAAFEGILTDAAHVVLLILLLRFALLAWLDIPFPGCDCIEGLDVDLHLCQLHERICV